MLKCTSTISTVHGIETLSDSLFTHRLIIGQLQSRRTTIQLLLKAMLMLQNVAQLLILNRSRLQPKKITFLYNTEKNQQANPFLIRIITFILIIIKILNGYTLINIQQKYIVIIIITILQITMCYSMNILLSVIKYISVFYEQYFIMVRTLN